MKTIYGIPDRFSKYDLNLPVSKSNPGGGIAVKARRVFEAWSQWYDDIEMLESWWDIQERNVYLVIEPLSFIFGREDMPKIVEAYEKHPAFAKILYGSELSIMHIPYEYRERIFKASDIITTCCQFQERVFYALGIKSIRFCDPVPETVFYSPHHQKELSVVACGSISDIKQSSKIVDIFTALKGKIKLIYVGGATLWGTSKIEDDLLESEIRRVSDKFYHNVAQAQVAKVFQRASCGIFDTAHETCSESNQEFLMAGGRAYYGLHGLWDERPGVHDLEDTLSFVSAISAETQEFKVPPMDTKREEAETWALRNCSYTTFMEEWKEILRRCKLNSSTNTI